MKKTISVIVAIAMMLMVSIPAFAGNFDDNADLTAQQKVFAEVIFDGLNAGNNTADTLANYVGSNLDYKADITSPDTIADDVSVALEAANAKLAAPITDENVLNTMMLKLYATITGRSVPTGSTTILVSVVKGKDVTVEGINAAMKAAESASFGYTEEQLVSSDIIGITQGSLFDATQTMVNQIGDDLYEVQTVSWYDNENSYTSQMVRTIKYFSELG